MRNLGGAGDGARPSEQPAGKYIVCVGGYPRSEASTYREAVTLAKKMRWFAPDGAFSVYEVDTSIHFDVPESFFLDELAVLPNAAPDTATTRALG